MMMVREEHDNFAASLDTCAPMPQRTRVRTWNLRDLRSTMPAGGKTDASTAHC